MTRSAFGVQDDRLSKADDRQRVAGAGAAGAGVGAAAGIRSVGRPRTYVALAQKHQGLAGGAIAAGAADRHRAVAASHLAEGKRLRRVSAIRGAGGAVLTGATVAGVTALHRRRVNQAAAYSSGDGYA